MATDLPIAALEGLLSAELARRELLPFASLVYPGFQAPPHLRYLAGLLERVDSGEIKRLVVSLHPGSGKSTLLQLFQAWYLGRHPGAKVIATSAAAELAERNSRATRSFIADDKWPFESRITDDTRAQNRWSTTDGSSLFAIGAQGTISGWRSSLTVADDLQNSYGTPTEADSLWTWFREILTPRLEPGGSIVVIQTRWGEMDIPGRLLAAEDGHTWTYVALPAIAAENDLLGREPGEALWPERFGIEELEQRRMAMGSRAFSSQFLCQPIQLEGNLIKSAWLQRYDKPPACKRVVMALDAAAKTGVSNDFSALAVLGVTDNGFYLLDMIRKKVEYPELIKMVVNAYEKYAPSAIHIEDTSNAVALIQQLKRESHLPIVAVKPTGSKISRVEGITGTLEAGKVFLPNEAPWLMEFERELFGFPGGTAHDDCVDSFTMAIASQAKPRPFVGFIASSGADGVTTFDDSDNVLSDYSQPQPAGVPSSTAARLTSALRGIW